MAASTWLRDVLDGTRRVVRIVGAGPRAAYADLDDRTVVAIEAATGARLPNAVGITVLPRLHPGQVGVIGGGLLDVGPLRARVGRWWDPHPAVPADRASAAGLRRHRDELATPGSAHLIRHGLGDAVAALAAAAADHDGVAVDPVLDQLIGRGPGSTPSGDDVVAGLLATLVTLGRPDGPVATFAVAVRAGVARRGDRTAPLSATLLRCAADGAVAAAVRRVLALLAAPAAAAPARSSAIATLAGLGHTSGRDLLTGIGIGVDALIAEGNPA
jgi:hypothetical protein